MFRLLTINSAFSKDLGLVVLRVGIGLIFLKHGWSKLMSGPQAWEVVGKIMGFLGIQAYPVFWGFLAACSEFFGGALLTIGLYTRVAAFFMGCVMLGALSLHLHKFDPFSTLAHPLSLLVVFLSLCISGSGRFSIDRLLKK